MLMRTFAERTQDFATHNRKAPDHALSYPSRVMVHPKLAVSQPNDHEEVEAEKAASEVMSFGKIQRKVFSGSGDSGLALPSRTASDLGSTLGSGFSMPSKMAQSMGASFGADFSAVRFHTDESAIRKNQDINAEAFTYGNDIYFNRGKYSPNTDDGKRLIAHELAHTLQGGEKVRRQSGASYPRFSSKEEEAEIAFLKYKSCGSDLAKEEKLKYGRKYNSQFSSTDKRSRIISDMIEAFVRVSENTILRAQEDRKKGITLRPVSVAIRMSPLDDYNDAFVSENFYGELEKRTYKGSEIMHPGFGDQLIVLQDLDSVSDASRLLSIIDKYVGPIRNLIITGHGNWNSIALKGDSQFITTKTINSNLSEENSSIVFNDESDPNIVVDPTDPRVAETMAFFQTLRDLMPEDSLERSIVLEACLTGAHKHEAKASQMNMEDILISILGWKNVNKDINLDYDPKKGKDKKNNVYAPKSPLYGLKFDLFQKTRRLKIDPVSVTNKLEVYEPKSGFFEDGIDVEARLLAIAHAWVATQDRVKVSNMITAVLPLIDVNERGELDRLRVNFNDRKISEEKFLNELYSFIVP